jgi:DNA polymerase-3 subunit gamma/tau
VSPQGFNALLKLVEEPPPHLKFIFATTEPDKVIGTIRSRTHHYPFRLVPPKVLGDYLLELCKAEGVTLEPNALPLVVRAGQGSVRDTLSVLDQLLGGAGPSGVTYDLAVQLLGYTPDALLDEAIDAFAASDGGTVFGVVDKVIESGQDPRRFAEDFLQRLRDLVIVAAVPDALSTGLLDVPGDRAERLLSQASGFGPSELTRAADIVNAALLEFRGATAPRLLLELMCARILVPGSDNSTQGFQARLDRVERRLSMDGGAVAPPPVEVRRPPAAEASKPPPAEEPAEVAPVESAAPVASAPPADEPAEALSVELASPVEPAPPVELVETPTPEAELAPAPAAAGNLTIADVRRLWPEVLDKIRELRRFTWVMLSQNAQVMSLDGTALTIALVNPGARDSFVNSGSADYVQKALHDVLGVSWTIDAIVDPTVRPGSTDDALESEDPAPPAEPKRSGEAAPASVREALREPATPQTREDPDDAADRDDPVIESETIDPEMLLSRELGAEVIDESRTD